jgi:hypothetical protein
MGETRTQRLAGDYLDVTFAFDARPKRRRAAARQTLRG